MEIARRKRGMVNICLRSRTERERDGKKKERKKQENKSVGTSNK